MAYIREYPPSPPGECNTTIYPWSPGLKAKADSQKSVLSIWPKTLSWYGNIIPTNNIKIILIWDLQKKNSPFSHYLTHLVYPPKFCIKIVFDFSWDDCNTQGKSETGYVKFCGLKQGVLWSLSKFASCMWGNPTQSWILDSTPWIEDSGYWIAVFVSGTWTLDSSLSGIPGA